MLNSEVGKTPGAVYELGPRAKDGDEDVWGVCTAASAWVVSAKTFMSVDRIVHYACPSGCPADAHNMIPLYTMPQAMGQRMAARTCIVQLHQLLYLKGGRRSAQARRYKVPRHETAQR